MITLCNVLIIIYNLPEPSRVKYLNDVVVFYLLDISVTPQEQAVCVVVPL